MKIEHTLFTRILDANEAATAAQAETAVTLLKVRKYPGARTAGIELCPSHDLTNELANRRLHTAPRRFRKPPIQHWFVSENLIRISISPNKNRRQQSQENDLP